MTPRRRRMGEDLPRRGLALKTPQGDLAAVRQLAHHDPRAPDQVSEEELRQDFLCRLNEQKVAESTFRLHLDGIRFLDERTLRRPWPVFERIRPRKSQTLPIVWSRQEVRHLLGWVHHPKARMCLRML